MDINNILAREVLKNAADPYYSWIARVRAHVKQINDKRHYINMRKIMKKVGLTSKLETKLNGFKRSYHLNEYAHPVLSNSKFKRAAFLNTDPKNKSHI